MDTHYDILIIGSGAGGGTLAHRLVLAGKKVLLLERGSFLPQEKANWSTQAVFVENRYHTNEVWRDRDGRPLHPGTGYWVGGNTKVFGAALFRLRERDFETVQHRGGISPAWPVKYDIFEPYYAEAENLYAVHGQRGLDPTEPYRSSEYPHPPVSNEPHMQVVHDSLSKLGLHPFPTPLGIMLDEQKPVESKCIRCDTCDGYPCLVHAKSDADVICVRPLLGMPNFTLVTGARATRIVTGSSGTSVTGVEVELDGQRTQFSADLYALSAGAINSAALLLRSANSKHPNGLANGSDQVGRNFMFHQADTVLSVNRKATRARYMKTVSVNDFYFGTKDYPYPMGNVQPLGSVHAGMLRADAPALAPTCILRLMAEHATPWWLTTEDLPDPNNRVRVVGDSIHLDYKRNNEESFHRLCKAWIDTLKAVGQADHWRRLRAYLKKRVSLEGVGHQNGTCRFGIDPRESVLDPDCRTHEVDNLYVVDASFFPSCGAVNPALTVIANSLRVADHLLARMSGGRSS